MNRTSALALPETIGHFFRCPQHRGPRSDRDRDHSIRVAILTGPAPAFSAGGNVELSAAMQAVTHHTGDRDEAVAAMPERRAPRFTGN